MKFIAWLIRVILYVAEKVLSELAILAALFSTTEGGSYFDRALGGMFDNFWALYAFAKAYVTNVKFDDFMTQFAAAIDEGLALVSLNVKANCKMVVWGMLVTFIAWKVFAYVLRLIRKKVMKRRKKDDEGEKVKRPPERRPATGGRTYQQLYNKEQPPAHTPPPKPQGTDTSSS